MCRRAAQDPGHRRRVCAGRAQHRGLQRGHAGECCGPVTSGVSSLRAAWGWGWRWRGVLVYDAAMDAQQELAACACAVGQQRRLHRDGQAAGEGGGPLRRHLLRLRGRRGPAGAWGSSSRVLVHQRPASARRVLARPWVPCRRLITSGVLAPCVRAQVRRLVTSGTYNHRWRRGPRWRANSSWLCCHPLASGTYPFHAIRCMHLARAVLFWFEALPSGKAWHPIGGFPAPSSFHGHHRLLIAAGTCHRCSSSPSGRSAKRWTSMSGSSLRMRAVAPSLCQNCDIVLGARQV